MENESGKISNIIGEALQGGVESYSNNIELRNAISQTPTGLVIDFMMGSCLATTATISPSTTFHSQYSLSFSVNAHCLTKDIGTVVFKEANSFVFLVNEVISPIAELGIYLYLNVHYKLYLNSDHKI